ncbi:uncharacterized protein n4bp2l2 isoform X2 [Brachyhypopomus gauderio]|uniref:uncharacterized protein n4bp2l2 isoform X2 n=1 Tax=Brachyhypopomus gauderio TaxID=698409 RepID=UPI0040413F41
MPNVNPDKLSSPPLSGKVEDVQNLGCCDLAATEGQHELENDGPIKSSPSNPVEGGSGDAAHVCHERSKEEVIKEIGVSSTAFIGPSCRPPSAIEEELSEFYKELEEIDHQDVVDGMTTTDEDLPQPCRPTDSPAPGKESRGTDVRKAHRPYPAPRTHDRPRQDYGNTRIWRPQSHGDVTWDDSYSYSYQDPWPHAPPRLPQNLQRFQFQEPQRFLPLPPPGNPMHHPYFEPDYNPSESSRWRCWEETPLPLGHDMGFTPSYRPGSCEWYERHSSDWQPYNEQDSREEDPYKYNGESFVLILMRGLPGSGKSTLAKEIVSTVSTGLILSTDDYFFQENGYFFDPSVLGDAHEWNQQRAREAMLAGRSPVVIDNTNIHAWEMKPYVTMALEIGYRVEFVEPDTSWKCDSAQLEKRNKHGVPRETIAKMLDRFELPMTVDIVMNSREPPHKSRAHLSRPNVQKRFDDL